MERMTWLTEQRTAASATGAPSQRRVRVGEPSFAGIQVAKHIGLVPAAYGPGLVCGDSVSFHTNDHVATGRTAWDGMPLGSRGAGYG